MKRLVFFTFLSSVVFCISEHEIHIQNTWNTFHIHVKFMFVSVHNLLKAEKVVQKPILICLRTKNQ